MGKTSWPDIPSWGNDVKRQEWGELLFLQEWEEEDENDKSDATKHYRSQNGFKVGNRSCYIKPNSSVPIYTVIYRY